MRRAAPVTTGDEEAVIPVLAGIEHHLSVDRWFHAAEVFRGGERRAAERIREARMTAPRMTLFAHILWELCLDGELVRRVGLAAMLDALRDGFGRVQGMAGDRAVDLHHFQERPRLAGDRAAFDARMRRIFEALAAGPWIEGYQHGAGIASRVEGVRVGIGLGRMDPEDHARLGAVADALLERARPAVDEILTAPPPW